MCPYDTYAGNHNGGYIDKGLFCMALLERDSMQAHPDYSWCLDGVVVWFDYKLKLQATPHVFHDITVWVE